MANYSTFIFPDLETSRRALEVFSSRDMGHAGRAHVQNLSVDDRWTEWKCGNLRIRLKVRSPTGAELGNQGVVVEFPDWPPTPPTLIRRFHKHCRHFGGRGLK